MKLVVLSGGLDSTCALAVTGAEAAVSFHYGQRHRRELDQAKAIARHYRIPHTIINLEGLLSGSALLGATEVPEGHYAEESMSQTVVQGRNLLFAAAAIGHTQPGDSIIFGVHAGDHPIYPDCRPEFWTAVGFAADAYEVAVETPFVTLTKDQLLARGVEAGAPVDLTWSCYKGGPIHCGRCGTCVERAEAFDLAGIPDPTVYADPAYWREVVHVSDR